MGILKDSAVSVSQDIFQQMNEKEYITWDHEIGDTWQKGDDVLDVLPDGAADMFWIAFEVPSSGLATAPVVDEPL